MKRPDGTAFWHCPRCGTPNPRARYLTQCLACGGPLPASTPASPPPEPTTRRRPWLVAATWGYAAVVVVVFVLIRTRGERWWPATLLLFSPRVGFVLPAIALAFWAARRRRWAELAVNLVVAAVVLGPLMGYNVPWGRLTSSRPQGPSLRVLTLNRGLDCLDASRLIDLIERQQIDLIFFQEGPRPDPALLAFFAEGWHRDSQGFIFSRHPIVSELDSTELPWYEYGAWPLRIWRVRVRLASGTEVLAVSVNLPTAVYAFGKLRAGDRAGYGRYMAWRREQVDRLLGLVAEGGDVPVVIGGDFNMPPDSALMSPLRARFSSGFEEAGWGYGYTRPAAFPWARIDDILASPEWRFTRCGVGLDVGSDHLPMVAEVVLNARGMAAPRPSPPPD